MARFRHHPARRHSALDWIPEGDYGQNGKKQWHIGWLSNMENGDWIHVMPEFDRSGETGTHEYRIFGGVPDEDSGEFPILGTKNGYTDPEHAKSDAEKHYYSLDHSNRQKPNSGVDYSDLNQIMRDQGF